MRKLTLLLLVNFCIGVVYSTSAQQNIFAPPPIFDTKVKYKKTVISYYTVEKNAPVTILDKSYMSTSQMTQLVEKYYKGDGSKPTILITSLESSTLGNALRTNDESNDNPQNTCDNDPTSSYKKPSYNFKLNGKGISAFDKDGNFIKKHKPSDKYRELTSQAGETSIFIPLPEINEAYIQSIQNSNAGLVVDATLLSSGTIRARTNNSIITYDENKKTHTIIETDQNGNALRNTIKAYRSVQSINPLHNNSSDAVLTFKKEIREKKLPGGVCGNFVKITLYEDYEIQKQQSDFLLRETIETLNSEVDFYPNPASETLTICNNSDDNLHLYIFNIEGKLLKEKKSADETTLKIADLSPGSYFLLISSSSGKKIHKFIKQ